MRDVILRRDIRIDPSIDTCQVYVDSEDVFPRDADWRKIRLVNKIRSARKVSANIVKGKIRL